MSRRDAESAEEMQRSLEINRITGLILDACIRVHREIGPGVLESVYEVILAKRLRDRVLVVERQRVVPLTIDEEIFGEVFRIDLFVENLVVIELRSVVDLHPVHFKKTLTYLRLLQLPLGLLINFGEPTLKQGFQRVANNLQE